MSGAAWTSTRPDTRPPRRRAPEPAAPDDDGEPAPAQPPARPALRAAHQFAPVLSKLQVAWDLAAKLAHAPGAYSDVVRRVRVAGRDRNGTRTRQPRPQPQSSEAELSSALPAVLRSRPRRAASPTPYSLAAVTWAPRPFTRPTGRSRPAPPIHGR